MKKWIAAFQLISFRVIGVLIFFLILFHIYSVFSEAQYLKTEISNAMFMAAADLEGAINRGNLFEAKNTLWSIKPDGIMWVSLRSPQNRIFWDQPVMVGQLTETSSFLHRKFSFPLKNRGLNLGILEFGVSYLELSKLVLKRNLVFYLTLVLITFLALTFTLQGIVSVLLGIEKDLEKVSRLEGKVSEMEVFKSTIGKSQSLRTSSFSSIYIAHLSKVVSTLGQIADLQKKNASLNARAEMAAEIAHDIRSPLSALNLSLNHFVKSEDPNHALVKSSLERINSIAAGLLRDLKKNQGNSSFLAKTSQPSLKQILPFLIMEKCAQYSNKPNVSVILDDSDLERINPPIPSSDLTRVLSNLINNSVESISSAGEVIVSARKYKNEGLITIRDNGCGIPEEVLCMLGEKEITTKIYENESGNGLGMIHAFKTIKKYGGNISISSKIGVGTVVSIRFPHISS